MMIKLDNEKVRKKVRSKLIAREEEYLGRTGSASPTAIGATQQEVYDAIRGNEKFASRVEFATERSLRSLEGDSDRHPFDELVDKIGIKAVAVGYLRSKIDTDLARKILEEHQREQIRCEELHCISKREKNMLEDAINWVNSFTDEEFLNLYNKVVQDTRDKGES